MMEKRLVDLATFIAAAFKKERYHKQAKRFFEKIDKGEIEAFTLHIIAIEAELLYLSGRVRVPPKEWINFITDILESLKIEKIPLTSNIFIEHTRFYKGFHGKYTFFDSFYASAAKILGIKLVTTDETLLSDAEIPTDDLTKY
jgi:predicted nucleic acid-binding protein